MNDMKSIELTQMMREYQQVLSMSEAEVLASYEDSKADVVASFEAEIDYWYNAIYGEKEQATMTFNLDPAFASFDSVVRMFV